MPSIIFELAKKEAQVVEEQLVASVKKPADAKKYETEVQAEANKIKSIKDIPDKFRVGVSP